MKWQTYPKYEDSDVEWLGEIPAHWETRRLKYISSLNDETLGETTDPDFQLLYVDISSVDAIAGIQHKEKLAFGDAPSRARRKVRHGDVIVSTVRTYLRAIAPVVEPEANLIVSTGFAVVRPMNELESQFALYALRAPYFVEEVVANSVGVSYPAINASELATLFVALPPQDEQRAIAAFLDRETERIDALIARKERQIELLQEKRAALISHAVTRGLDPNAPMKDSGVKWVGEVPKHWEVEAVWMLFRLGRGRVISNEEISNHPGEYPVFSSQTESEGVFGYIDTFDFEGDFLTWTTDGANAGTVFERHGRFNCTNVCGTLHATCPISYTFFQHAINQATSWFVRHDINPKLMNNVMASIRVQVPPIQEQDVIASFINQEAKDIDALISKVHESITTLHEYRTALISAAVTGKIQVQRTSYAPRN